MRSHYLAPWRIDVEWRDDVPRLLPASVLARAIAGALEVHPATVARVRRAYVEDGLEAALSRKSPDRVYARALDGAAEARLVALVCGDPPEGRERWTLRLLADELVRLEVADAVSHETVRRTLKQTSSSPG